MLPPLLLLFMLPSAAAAFLVILAEGGGGNEHFSSPARSREANFYILNDRFSNLNIYDERFEEEKSFFLGNIPALGLAAAMSTFQLHSS